MSRPPHDESLPDHLAEVAETLRRHGPEPTALQLDEVKRRAIRKASRPRKGPFMRSKLVTLLLAAGLTVTAGTAGVIASGNGKSNGKSAAKSQYNDGKSKCNAGNGNGSDAITFVQGEHCYGGDPGNSYNAGNRGGDEIAVQGSVPNPGGNNVP